MKISAGNGVAQKARKAMRDVALCGNWWNCDYEGCCDRRPNRSEEDDNRQNWAYFYGTDECPAEIAKQAQITEVMNGRT